MWNWQLIYASSHRPVDCWATSLKILNATLARHLAQTFIDQTLDWVDFEAQHSYKPFGPCTSLIFSWHRLIHIFNILNKRSNPKKPKIPQKWGSKKHCTHILLKCPRPRFLPSKPLIAMCICRHWQLELHAVWSFIHSYTVNQIITT